MAENKVGKFIGGTLGTAAGAGLIGMLDGPSPILDIVGGNLGGAIGGAIGGKLPGGKGKRMAGEALKYNPLAMAGLMEGMPMVNPNTQMMAGMGIVDPNPSKVLQEYAMY